MPDQNAIIQITERPSEATEDLFIPQPRTVEETGLDFGMLLDLCVKSIYYAGRPAARDIAGQIALPFTVIQELLKFLKQEQLCEVVSGTSINEQNYHYTLTAKGAAKADEVMERSRYIGPAPVPFATYLQVLEQQSIKKMRIERERAAHALDMLVLHERTLHAIGPAVNSGRAVLLYGPSGNGKSTIAKAIGDMLEGTVLVPHAIEVSGQIIKVFDTHSHEPINEDTDPDRRVAGDSAPPAGIERRRDRRWVQTRRPLVIAGGELTLRDLELRYDSVSKFYMAPLQVKANGGALVIDDFGRQIVQPRELLNRWIVPMDKGWDNLTLQTGESVEIPFDVLLIFSTNLAPAQLGDEAFFRRIPHKVEVGNPSREHFVEILRRSARTAGVAFSEDAAAYLVERHYEQTGRSLRGCHPSDLIQLVVDIAQFRGIEPHLEPDLLDVACESYFIET